MADVPGAKLVSSPIEFRNKVCLCFRKGFRSVKFHIKCVALQLLGSELYYSIFHN